MNLTGMNWQSDVARFGFQNQIKDVELGMVNFKYRQYSPAGDGFLTVDPLAINYPWNSPYAFSENRVVDGLELEGLEYANVHTGESLGPIQTEGFKESIIETMDVNGNSITDIYLPEVEITAFSTQGKMPIPKEGKHILNAPTLLPETPKLPQVRPERGSKLAAGGVGLNVNLNATIASLSFGPSIQVSENNFASNFNGNGSLKSRPSVGVGANVYGELIWSTTPSTAYLKNDFTQSTIISESLLMGLFGTGVYVEGRKNMTSGDLTLRVGIQLGVTTVKPFTWTTTVSEQIKGTGAGF